MSREIKFRAWSEYSNKLVVWEHMKPEDTLGSVLNGDDKKIHVMQYTGLKDKNGREIYEGDIVRKTHNGKENFMGQVIYSEGTYFLELPPEEYVFLFDEYRIYENEVIGNIYEHPHLLEVPQ